MDEAPDRLVIEADRVGDGGATRARRTVDRRRIAIEAVQIDDAAGGRTVGVVDAQYVVDRLQHEAIAGAERLVGRLDTELVAIVGEALVEEVEALKMRAQSGIGFRAGVRADGLAVAGRGAGQRAV